MTGPRRLVPLSPHAAAAALVVLGVVLRFVGLDAGLPFLYDPDEPDFVERAFAMLETGDLNPHWFGHPGTTVMYLQATAFSVYALVGQISGHFGSFDEVVREFRTDPATFYLLGRLVSLVAAAGTLALTYRLALRITSPWTAVVAVLMLALMPLGVQHARLARTDLVLSVLVLATTICSVDIARHGALRSYLGAGFLLGLGVATKYPALVFAIPLGAAHLLRRVDAGESPWAAPAPLLAAALACLAGVAVGSPYLLIEANVALANVAREARSYHLGATSDGYLSTLTWYVLGVGGQNLGLAGLGAAVIGAGTLLRAGNRPALVLIAGLVSFLLFIAGLGLRWDRWLLPVLPALAILASVGITAVADAIADRIRTVPRRPLLTGITALGVALAMTLPAADAVLWTRAFVEGDTRTSAGRWILANVPAGSSILVETYTPQLPKGRYRLYSAQEGRLWRQPETDRRYVVPSGIAAELFDVASIWNARIDYVVLSNHYDRRLAEPDRYARVLENYSAIMSRGELVFEAQPSRGRIYGPPQRIYRLSR